MTRGTGTKSLPKRKALAKSDRRQAEKRPGKVHAKERLDPSHLFIGRTGLSRKLSALLRGESTARANGSLTIQSIEGPGGIGKTALFDHVLVEAGTDPRRYLTLRINGGDPLGASAFHAVGRLVDSAHGGVISRKPPGYHFPNSAMVTAEYENVCRSALRELSKLDTDIKFKPHDLLSLFDRAVAVGKPLNEMLPKSKQLIDSEAVERRRGDVERVLKSLSSLQEEGAKMFERLGAGGGAALRNAIKQNALVPLSQALVTDLTTILVGYERREWYKPAQTKLDGVDRLLLVIDDYEKVQSVLGEFLVSHLLPHLQRAPFETIAVIIGRDQLSATHPGWDQHLRASAMPPISLAPLTRAEMNSLVASYGVSSGVETERAWADTQGYPYYVQLWVEEATSGGGGALMLKKFYDRTTRWMTEEQRDWLSKILFLDDVNIRTLCSVTESEEEARSAYRWFETEGSVRDTSASTFTVRPYLRTRLLDYLKISDPDLFDRMSRKVSAPLKPTASRRRPASMK